uniref:WRKY46 n=1 Tax=Glycyrrhiza glabra TaxID=49827 RepID=A0A7G3LS51_GLYGL|nr:WRKY46 [Glycyrrhiza glabra]
MAEHSSEALPAGATELHRKGNDSESNDGNQEEKEKAEEIKERVGESPSATELQRGDLSSSNEHTMVPNSETLGAVPSSVVQHRSSGTLRFQWSVLVCVCVLFHPSDFFYFNFLVNCVVDVTDLQGSPTALNSDGRAESKETVGPPEKEIIEREAAEAPPTQTGNQLQVSVCSTPFSELTPNSVTQSLSSVASPTIRKQKMSPPKTNNMHLEEVDRKKPSGGKALSPVSVARTSAPDGYNWRKYGQKQVKSPTGSRSYYRCTHSNCCAKKVECCDHSGHVIEIVYKSEHSHDPPQKTNSIRESKHVSSNEPTAEKSVSEKPIRVVKDPDPSISSKPLQEAPCSADKKRQNSSNISDNGKVILKEEHLDEPEPKRRKEKGDLTDSDSLVKLEKKPKLVVHAAGDVGISGDGYRWRKYGQKMVKGNPHPRCIPIYSLLSFFLFVLNMNLIIFPW